MPRSKKPPTVRFTEPWDKTTPERFQVGAMFTTARGYIFYMHKYYSTNIDKIFTVELLTDKKSKHYDLLGRGKLFEVEFTWALDVTDEFIRHDTYAYYMREDWYKLMKKFYGITNPFLIVPHFAITEVIGVFENGEYRTIR